MSYDCLLISVAFVVLCRVGCLWVTGVCVVHLILVTTTEHIFDHERMHELQQLQTAAIYFDLLYNEELKILRDKERFIYIHLELPKIGKC